LDPRLGIRENPWHHDRAKKEGTLLQKVLPQFNADVERSSAVIAHNPAFDLPIGIQNFCGAGWKQIIIRINNSVPRMRCRTGIFFIAIWIAIQNHSQINRTWIFIFQPAFD